MTRRVLFAVMAAALSVPALSAQQDVMARDAKSMEQKLSALFDNGQLPVGKAKPLRTTFTENEVNAFMVLSKDVELPVGVRDPRLTIEAGNRLSGRAVVDLDKVRLSKPRSVLDPMNLLLRGTVEVKAQGILQTANRKGTFTVESATLSGVPIPKSVLQELVYFYTKTPDHPSGYTLDSPFELPMNIRAIEFVRGSATIVQ
jgi:hypothetical protein